MSILEELYSGNINPSGKYIKKGSEYQRLIALLTDDIDELMKRLSDEEKQLVKRIEDNIYKLDCITERERFIDGFSTGVRMIIESINYNSENFI